MHLPPEWLEDGGSPFADVAAIHEAGHMVAALSFGCEVKGADLAKGSGGYVGATWHSKPPTDLDDAVITFAGPVAEIMLGEALHVEVTENSGIAPWTDDAKVIAHLSDVEYQAAVMSAREILTRQWAAVELIADGLLARLRADVGDVRTLR